MRTAEVLRLFDERHARLDATLARMSRARMETPGADGGWSAKAIIAHITWSKRERFGVLRQRALAADAG